MKTINFSKLLVSMGILCIAASASIADTAESARKIMDANSNAIVSIQIVVEMTASYQGQSDKQQSKTSATGTVIDPSGLVVTSATAINPRDRLSDLMDDSDSDYKVSSKIVDIKIKTADGTEIPANVVLQDRDLDIAYIKPQKPLAKPAAYIDFTQSAAPQAVDELAFVYRLGQIGNRSIAAAIGRVSAVITKPRLFYVVSESSSSLGMPAFALDGKPIGILVLRSSASKSNDDDMFASDDKMLPVVMPCATIQKAVEQAKNAQPQQIEEEKTPEQKPASKAPAQKKNK